MSESAARAHVLFDLDDTLYPAGTGLFRYVSKRIHAYIQRELALEPEPARTLQRRYWKEYGTSLFGLMQRHAVEPEPFLAYVHDVPVEEILAPDPRLRALLETLPASLHVFTNGPSVYARRVLARLGVADLFDEIFDIASFGYVPKPHDAPYERTAERLGAGAGPVILVEDAPRNLPPARARGWATIWLSAPESWQGGAPGLSHREAGRVEADAVVDGWEELERALGTLLDHGDR